MEGMFGPAGKALSFRSRSIIPRPWTSRFHSGINGFCTDSICPGQGLSVANGDGIPALPANMLKAQENEQNYDDDG